MNRPDPSSALLRIHQHTIPSCIALQSLIARCMPYEPFLATGNQAPSTSQDLPQLVRELYQEIVSYHRRQEEIKVLRDSTNVESGERGDLIKEFSAMDAGALEVRVE